MTAIRKRFLDCRIQSFQERIFAWNLSLKYALNGWWLCLVDKPWSSYAWSCWVIVDGMRKTELYFCTCSSKFNSNNHIIMLHFAELCIFFLQLDSKCNILKIIMLTVYIDSVLEFHLPHSNAVWVLRNLPSLKKTPICALFHIVHSIYRMFCWYHVEVERIY